MRFRWLTVGVLLLAANVGMPRAALNTANVIPPSDLPYGMTYAEWAVKYYQWAFAFPRDADPEADTGPANANQSGPVWFLGSMLGGFCDKGPRAGERCFDSTECPAAPEEAANCAAVGSITRQITVPQGTALFFPVLASEFDNTTCDDPPPPELSAAQLQSQANRSLAKYARLAKWTLDGGRGKSYVAKTGGFSYTVASSNNIDREFCVADGEKVEPAAAKGRFVMLAPLGLGEHVIVIEARVGPRSHPFFEKKITYNVTVE